MQLPSGELGDGTAFLSAQTSLAPVDGDAVKPNGSVLRVQGRPIPDGHYIITYTDVTNLKQSELAYRDQASRLAAILDNVVDAIITINESGSIESWSKGAERLFGYKAEEVLRRNVRMLMPEPHASAHDSYIRRYLQTGERRIMGGAARSRAYARMDKRFLSTSVSASFTSAVDAYSSASCGISPNGSRSNV
jgi:PAS domain S-box-containing protein